MTYAEFVEIMNMPAVLVIIFCMTLFIGWIIMALTAWIKGLFR